MKHITEIRKSVCTIANSLRATGLTASDAFRKAWARVKKTTFRVAGVTMENRQQALRTLANTPADDVQIGLRREPGNQYDANAVQVLAKINSKNRFAVLGYLPRILAERWAGLMDQGIRPRVTGQVIGGGYGFSFGFLVTMAV